MIKNSFTKIKRQLILLLPCTRSQKNTNVRCNTYTNFFYLYLSYLLIQLIYARTQSPQKGGCLFHRAWNMTNDCVSLMMGVKLMTEGYKKNTYIKSKGQCKDKISVSKRIHIFSCTIMIAKHLTKTFILTCCRLTLIYCPYFSIMLTIRSVILKSTLH